MTWQQHAVVKKLDAFGQVFGISFLQTGASLERTRRSRGGTCHLCVRKDICYLPPLFFYIELYECRVKIWNYSGFVWPFYTLIEFLGI